MKTGMVALLVAMAASTGCTKKAAAPAANATTGASAPTLVQQAPAVKPEVSAGRQLAESNAVIAAIRAGEPAGARRDGFDAGIGLCLAQKADAAAQDTYQKSLAEVERAGFADGAAFAAEWRANSELAARGASIAMKDAGVAEARSKGQSHSENALAAGLYLLGFDTATAIFGDARSGALEASLLDADPEKIRGALGKDGQRGFRDAVAYHAMAAIRKRLDR